MAYINVDTSSWSVKDVPNDNSRYYENTFNLRAQGSSVGPGSSGPIPNFADVRVSANLDEGTYEVYRVIPDDEDVLIYTYSCKLDKYTVVNNSQFEFIFTGTSFTGENLRENFDNLNKEVRIATLSLSAKDASKSDQNRKADERLQKCGAYTSLSNTAQADQDSRIDGSSPVTVNGTVNTNQQPSDFTSVDIDLNSPDNNQDSAGRSSPVILRYPLEVPDLGYDFIKISAVKYVAAGFGQPNTNLTTRASERLSTILGTVVLPMQPSLEETREIDWGGNNLDLVRATAAGLAMNSIGSNNFKDAANALNTAKEELKGMLQDEGTKRFITAYFAGQAIGNNALTQRATGQVLNPNLELLFNGPKLRDFNFNFELTPRSEEESEIIKKIIRFFKKHSAPKQTNKNLFLKTPDVFFIEYIFNDAVKHPYLNKIKPCALRRLSVNYTPDGNYMTYGDSGSMTKYTLQMGFGELEPVFESDYDDSIDQGMGF